MADTAAAANQAAEDKHPVNEEREEEQDEDLVEEEDAAPPLLGGPAVARETPCFALLDGLHEDLSEEDPTRSRVTIPITRLPAVIGRSHDTDDPHFFGLGKRKALSRKHCQISYRDEEGGTVEWDEAANELVYKPVSQKGKAKKPVEPKSIANGKLPSRGFFVIECLGKNRIFVNKDRLDHGEVAVLKSGSPIRISSYTVYFLLPNNATPKDYEVELPFVSSAEVSSKTTTSGKKRKMPALVTSSSAPKKKSATAATGGNTLTAFSAELDSLPVSDLLDRMSNAASIKQQHESWDRKQQMLGGVICVHAVMAAANDPKLQQKVLDQGGVARSEIMEWMRASKQFGEWVEQMLAHMEPRSYSAAVTKSLLKSGFTRTGSSGRYIKWLLPKSVKMVVGKHASVDRTDEVDTRNGDSKDEMETKKSGNGGDSDQDENHSKGDDEVEDEKDEGEKGQSDTDEANENTNRRNDEDEAVDYSRNAESEGSGGSGVDAGESEASQDSHGELEPTGGTANDE